MANSVKIWNLLNITENEWYRLLRESKENHQKLASLLNINDGELYRLLKESKRNYSL
jgi:hypothetical protein